VIDIISIVHDAARFVVPGVIVGIKVLNCVGKMYGDMILILSFWNINTLVAVLLIVNCVFESNAL